MKLIKTLMAMWLPMLSAIILSTTVLSGVGLASGGLSTFADSNYDIGKNVFLHKLYCETCPLEQKPLDSNVINEIVQSLSTQGELASGLNEKERLAVIHFLKKRFNIL
ncbi:MAG: hypothetical protein GKR95_01975 [Gammaproteobacteria bacterium]|nr:hypothetical protein [Gammaproteobacteria bacterium]